MGVALTKQGNKNESAKDRLAQAFREALKPIVKSSAHVDTLVDTLMDAITGKFIVGVREPKPRRETHRALSLRLPEIGTSWTYERHDKTYRLTVEGEHLVKMEYDGKVERYESLKAAATAILGYVPGVSGWSFFFGHMNHKEVQERYGDR
jgi:hypothetical protein